MVFRILCSLLLCVSLSAQENIGDFTSIIPGPQTSDFIIPNSHAFQVLLTREDTLSDNSIFPGTNDFAGYVPINGSSENGYLSINSETLQGQVTVLDIEFNKDLLLWETTYSQAIDFESVGGTIKNCAGTVTPWNTVISCEEFTTHADNNNDGYRDFGWCVEVDPENKVVIDKLWALGNFRHENVTVHPNLRTVYQGGDQFPGYLYKFIADQPGDLSSGTLSVFKGLREGAGYWVEIENTSIEDRNTTTQQSADLQATFFDHIEEVEIGPDGMVYLAVTGEDRVFRFTDSDPLDPASTTNMETYVGNMVYEIAHENGTTEVHWRSGNDNMAFDGEGNLWVLQDGQEDYIWVVENGHTQENPKVKIFANTPFYSEPTGITFSPDYRFLFLSIQHPSGNNSDSYQEDASGKLIGFDKDVTLVIALNKHLGNPVTDNSSSVNTILYPNPSTNDFVIDIPPAFNATKIDVLNPSGKIIFEFTHIVDDQVQISLDGQAPGVYIARIMASNKHYVNIKLVKL